MHVHLIHVPYQLINLIRRPKPATHLPFGWIMKAMFATTLSLTRANGKAKLSSPSSNTSFLSLIGRTSTTSSLSGQAFGRGGLQRQRRDKHQGCSGCVRSRSHSHILIVFVVYSHSRYTRPLFWTMKRKYSSRFRRKRWSRGRQYRRTESAEDGSLHLKKTLVGLLRILFYVFRAYFCQATVVPTQNVISHNTR